MEQSAQCVRGLVAAFCYRSFEKTLLSHAALELMDDIIDDSYFDEMTLVPPITAVSGTAQAAGLLLGGGSRVFASRGIVTERASVHRNSLFCWQGRDSLEVGFARNFYQVCKDNSEPIFYVIVQPCDRVQATYWRLGSHSCLKAIRAEQIVKCLAFREVGSAMHVLQPIILC